MEKRGKCSLPPRGATSACLSGRNNPRGRGPAGAAYPVSLGLEIHSELAASVPEGLWPPHGICVFLESVVEGIRVTHVATVTHVASGACCAQQQGQPGRLFLE